MIVDSKYTKKFVSNSLTRKKYNELHDFAVCLRDFKNELSLYINSDLLKYLEMNKFEFITKMRNEFKGRIHSSFDKQVYQQVLDAYQNKFDGICRNLTFEIKTFKGFEFYKRDTKKNKKGDLKKVAFTKKKSHLTICLTYLARYGNKDTINYINSRIVDCDDKKREFYNTILRCCEKYGFQRLYALALSKRLRIIRHYSENPIEFTSLTFSGRSRKKFIIDYNNNYKSVIKAFISLSWTSRKTMDIPVKFSKDYHGRMAEYLKKSNDYEYTISFKEKQKQVAVNICKDGERYIPQVNGNTIGIDVNCKHNLFSLSDETTYDYDRKLVNDFCKLSLEVCLLLICAKH